jgi:hypothetical protein
MDQKVARDDVPSMTNEWVRYGHNRFAELLWAKCPDVL